MGREKVPSIFQFEPAATQVQRRRAFARFARLQHVRMQAVDDELAVLLVVDQAGVAEDAQVMRNVGQFVVQEQRDLRDRLRAGLQTLDDPQAFRIGQGLQEAGAFIGLQTVAHGWIFV